jgi:hypothetical protein
MRGHEEHYFAATEFQFLLSGVKRTLGDGRFGVALFAANAVARAVRRQRRRSPHGKLIAKRYRAVPFYSDGKPGPAIELRDLFAQFLNEVEWNK